MRSELEKIQQIERFLFGELSGEELMAFETNYNSNPDLKKQVSLQKMVMQGIHNNALRQEIEDVGKRYQQRANNGKGKGKTPPYSIGLGAILLIGSILTWLLFFNQDDAELNLSINPPFNGVDVPYENYQINASKGGNIITKSGSLISIPPHCFTNCNGDSIAGNIELKYREFNNNADIFISGIPMEYSENGSNFHFESAAMCDIRGMYNGKPLCINDGKRIHIAQTSYTPNKGFNVYRFDTVEGRWIEKGNDSPIVKEDDLEELDYVDTDLPSEFTYKKEELVKPRKQNPYSYSLFISFDPSAFPELADFKNVLFEVDENDDAYKPEHSEILWENVDVKKGRKKGSYKLIFTKGSQEVSYLVYPVFKDKDYEQALNVYEKKKAKRKKEEEKQKARLAKLKAEQEERKRINDSVNNLILQQNARIAAYNKTMKENSEQARIIQDLFNKMNFLLQSASLPFDDRKKLNEINADLSTIFPNKELIEKIYVDHRKRQISKVPNLNSKFYRTFSIDNFGVWNCDVPVNLPGGMSISARFKLEDNSALNQNVTLIDKQVRAVYKYYPKKFNKFRFDPKSHNIAFTVIDGTKLYYNNTISSIPLSKKGKSYTVDLTEYKKPLDTYEDVKQALDAL